MRSRLFKLPQQFIRKTNRSFHQSTHQAAIWAEQINAGVGPKTLEPFSTMSIIALFTNDFRFANEEEIYNLMTHMAGKGKTGYELNPRTLSDHHSIEVPQAVNRQRQMYLSLLAKRLPGVLDMAKELHWARYETLHTTPLIVKGKQEQITYFDRIAERLNIDIAKEDRVLKKGELIPPSSHQVVKQIAHHVGSMFGKNLLIGPYTRQELEVDWPAIRAALPQGKQGKTFHDLLMQIEGAAVKQPVKIAADTESEQTRKFSM